MFILCCLIHLIHVHAFRSFMKRELTERTYYQFTVEWTPRSSVRMLDGPCQNHPTWQLWHSFRIYITQSLRGRQRQSSATREKSISGYFNAALAGITKNCCAMDVQETKGSKRAPGRCHYCTIEHTPPTAMNLYTSLVAAART